MLCPPSCGARKIYAFSLIFRPLRQLLLVLSATGGTSQNLSKASALPTYDLRCPKFFAPYVAEFRPLRLHRLHLICLRQRLAVQHYTPILMNKKYVLFRTGICFVRPFAKHFCIQNPARKNTTFLSVYTIFNRMSIFYQIFWKTPKKFNFSVYKTIKMWYHIH